MENLPPQVIRKVAKEVSELVESPPEGIKVFVNEEDITDIQATIEGPGNTMDSVYHGFTMVRKFLEESSLAKQT